MMQLCLRIFQSLGLTGLHLLQQFGAVAETVLQMHVDFKRFIFTKLLFEDMSIQIDD